MQYWTKDIVIDPNDVAQNTWYANVFSGWGGPPNGLGGLYKTTNRGTSWTKLTSTTYIDRATSCTFNPNNANQIYLTSETNGLWTSNNINSATPTFTLVQSYPFQQPERVFFNPYNSQEVWVTSFGNGMKTGTISTTPTGFIDFAKIENEINLFPNPASEKITVSIENAKLKNYTYEISDITGRMIYKGSANTSGKTIDINISGLQNGTYILNMRDEANFKYSKKFVVEK